MASRISLKLWGRILVESPTAIPSAPWAPTEGELDREGNRFLVSAVVGCRPIGYLGAEDHLQGKGGQSRSMYRGRRRSRPSANCPVPLGVNQQILLAKLYHGISNRGISVGVILHGVADHVGDLVVPAVLQFPHRMQNPSLHRFQAIISMRNRAVPKLRGCVIEKPISIHVIDVNGIIVISLLCSRAKASGSKRRTEFSLHNLNLPAVGVFFGLVLFFRHSSSYAASLSFGISSAASFP